MPGNEGQEKTISLSSCRAKIAVMGKQLQTLNDKLTAQLQEYDQADLSVRLDYLEQLNRTFDQAQSALEESESEIEEDGRIGFTSLYLDIKSRLTRQMNAVCSRDMPRSSTIRQLSVGELPLYNTAVQKTKLPEIRLPKFGGSYTEWPSFFGLFPTVIHDNSGLSNLEKLHYLRTSLFDAALDTISSLELSDSNYEEAVKLLKNRFDNKLLHFQTHIKEIFSLKVVDGSSAASLRQFSDKLNAHLRAIQTIATKEQISYGFLIYLAASKMDKASQIKWEESLQTNELPSWANMTSFLDRRCRMLENMECSVLNMAPKPTFSKGQNTKSHHVHVASAASSTQCSLCDSAEHFITSCSLFGNLSPPLRFTEAKRLNLCLNCLRKGHMLKNCTSGRCRQCSSKHHTMLHLEHSPAEQPAASSTDLEGSSTSQRVLVSSSGMPKATAMSVLLATAIVLVKNQFGLFVPCRAILDSASQVNLIASRFVNRLRLKCDRTCATISGIGDGSFVINQSADIVVKSRLSDYSTSFTAMVVPSITDYQPSINISNSQWNIPKNIQLADPSFDKADRIDMLIGAELFFELMSLGQIKMAANSPILQKTLFGWVVAGGGFRSRHSSSLAISCSEIKEEEAKLSSVIKGFWEIENNIDSSMPHNDDELFCENHFMQHTCRLTSGAYSVRLPQIEGRGASSLGGSYERALQRFKSLEKKFKRAVSKLAALPIDDSVEGLSSSTGGVC